MKKKILMLLAIMMMASIAVKAQSQNDSLMLNLAKSINALVEFKMAKSSRDTTVKVISQSPSSAFSVLDRIQIKENVKMSNDRSYGITNIDLGHGDYTKKYDGSLAGMGLNTSEVFISPIAFNHLGNGDVSYVNTGYEWGFKSRKWNEHNWWLTKTFSRKTTLSFNWFNTNEYEASIKANYSAKFAHDLIEVGGNVESGVYSSLKDSIMKPYFSGGVSGSIFFLYGSIGLTYSKNIPYQSLYNSTGIFIPSYEIGVKSPSIKIDNNFLVGLSAMYCNYAIYQPKVYLYDVAGNVVEDTIIDTDAYKGSISAFDNYGNIFQIGVSTWDMKNFQVGFSAKVNLRNIGRYF